jgi:uncharacterized protein (TIGR02145 family)
MIRKTVIALILLNLLTVSCNRRQINKTVTDIEGNIYTTVVIGKYVLMAENLKVTTYSNGEKIPLITNDTLWPTLSSGAYCWYDNNVDYRAAYGALYNWYAVER